MWLRDRQSSIAMAWNLNSCVRTCSACSLHSGMSSQRKPSVRPRRSGSSLRPRAVAPSMSSIQRSSTARPPSPDSFLHRIARTDEKLPATVEGSEANEEGPAVTRPDLVLRPGRDGARLVPDVAYPRAFTLRIGKTDQSYVDLDDPHRLEFDYLQQIALVLDQLAPLGTPLRTVHVGGAAMSLARYVAVARPRSSQVVLEPDTELTAFVRSHLPLAARSGIRVRGVDGRSGVTGLRDGYADLVIMDAFVGPRTPAELTTIECWTDLRRVLTRTGTVIANVTD